MSLWPYTKSKAGILSPKFTIVQSSYAAVPYPLILNVNALNRIHKIYTVMEQYQVIIYKTLDFHHFSHSNIFSNSLNMITSMHHNTPLFTKLTCRSIPQCPPSSFLPNTPQTLLPPHPHRSLVLRIIKTASSASTTPTSRFRNTNDGFIPRGRFVPMFRIRMLWLVFPHWSTSRGLDIVILQLDILGAVENGIHIVGIRRDCSWAFAAYGGGVLVDLGGIAGFGGRVVRMGG